MPTKTILMCAPEFFDIEYEINPWMRTDNPSDKQLAAKQWQQLYSIYTEQLGWHVELIPPINHLPDMVFTANGGLVRNGRVALPHFRQPDRQAETEYFKQWFTEHGYQDVLFPKYDFEGEGDAFFWRDKLLIGYPWRTDKPAHKELGEYFGIDTISLQLIDPRFYHLDTAMTIINDDTITIYPPAFSEDTRALLHQIVPNIIEATDQDGLAYGCNSMCDGQNIVLPDGAHDLITTYKTMGLNVYPTPMSEFQKSGGAVKCLSLELR